MTPEPAGDLLLVGRVARPHGIRGHVIVNPETDFVEDRFRAGQVLLVGPEDRAEPREIVDIRFHLRRPILALAGIETMSDAEALAGAELWLPQGALGPLPEGTFYRHDLVGCEVRDTRDALVGRVTAVEGTLDRSHLVVDDTVMIPLVETICVEVDVPARRVIVNPPEGLLELYGRKPEPKLTETERAEEVENG
jgi:16S rRNA processing protein RimM